MFNYTSYFILPLVYSNVNGEVGLSTHRFGERAFGNAFLSPDLKCVIVSIDDLMAYTRFGKAHSFYRREWIHDHTMYVEFYIPQEFHSDVSLFLQGKYSQFSENARKLFHGAIRIVSMEGEFSEEDIRHLTKRLKEWPHLTGYNVNGYVIVPELYVATESPDSQYRIAYKSKLEKDLDVSIPDGIDLFDKPDPKKEIISNTIYKQAEYAKEERKRSEYE